MTDLDELERLLAKATKGPWIRHNNPKKWVSTLSPVSDEEWRANCDNDAELVIALRNAAPELIAAARRVAELEAENVRLREALEVVENPDKLLCCTGYHCGCQGATVGGYAAWVMRDDRNAALSDLIASTADEYGVQNDGTD